MTLDVFRAKRLYFSAEAFLIDVGRQPRKNDWIYKMDGRPIVQSKTYPAGNGNGTSVTLGQIKGTHFWVYPEWCQKEGEKT